ncbi:MAG TPA: RDD family protein [Terriglobales bacterium]|nr:RDD family protein [Terriglobales bacterium]
MDPEGFDPSEQQFASSLEPDESPPPESGSETQQLAGSSLATAAGRASSDPGAGVESTSDSLVIAPAEPSNHEPATDSVDDSELWKDAVASRIRSYKARRYRKLGQGSLHFNFESTTGNHVFLKPEFPFDVAPANFTEPEKRIEAGNAIVTSSPSNLASALAQAPEHELVTEEESEQERPEPRSRPARGPVPEQGKLIEFPRPSYMTHTVSELAEPVLTSPRILDVPESVPVDPPPLDGLCLETPAETNEQPLEVPLRVAPVSRRLSAALLDGLIVLLATAVFAVVALKVGPGQLLQDRRSTLAMAMSIPAMLWIIYQYVFLAYAGITPGMRLMRLHILHFEGEGVRRHLRQYRALMLLVSCCPAGLGFLWAFYDPDTLCWHDRITRTYVASRPH